MSQPPRLFKLLAAGFALLGATLLNAQTNLLTNGHFQNRNSVQTVQTHDCTGPSSATNWTATIQGPCVGESGVELETDLLLGSTSPFFTLDAHLIHIRSQRLSAIGFGNPGNAGILQVFDSIGGSHTRVLTSLWVYVVKGQVGMGAGFSGSFPLSSHSSKLGTWEHLVGLSASVPPIQFNIFSTDSGGSEFYADNAIACPADTDADLAACRLFVGDTGSGGGTGTIAGLTISPPVVTGGQGATGTLTLASPAPAGGVQATLTSNNPAAGVPASVTVAEGQTTTTFAVTTTTVSSTTNATISATSANTVSAGLTINPGGGGSQTGTITGLTITPSSVTGGQGATGSVTLSAPAQPGGVSVSLTSNNTSATVPPSVTVLQGQSSASFQVNTTPVASPTTATITATSANSASAGLTINPGGGGSQTGTITGLTISPPSVTGGQPATGTVALSMPAPAGGISVSLASNNTSATVPPSVTVRQGQNTAAFSIITTAVADTTTATITATSANTASADLAINPNGHSSGTLGGLTVTPSSVTGGQGATGTVTLSSPAPLGGIAVSLSSNNPSATVPSSVTVPQGQMTTSFPVATSAVASTTTATITATSGNSVSAILTINPAPPPCVGSLTFLTHDLLGGLSVQGLVTLTGNAGIGGQIVNLSSSSLFAQVPATVNVAAGQNQATFTVTTNPVLSLLTPIISANANACVAVTGSINLLP